MFRIAAITGTPVALSIRTGEAAMRGARAIGAAVLRARLDSADAAGTKE
ncbi:MULTISPECIES: hypothetical protein [unclassified Burkholderia]|nr:MULTISPECIES: hypothetical protein [unclassified Burkholderia]